jgi:acyl carrier protein
MTEKFKGVIHKWYNRLWDRFLYKYPAYHKSIDITDDMTLCELGMDSLDETELIMDLESAYDIVILDDELWEKDAIHMSFKDMCDWVESKPKENYEKILN